MGRRGRKGWSRSTRAKAARRTTATASSTTSESETNDLNYQEIYIPDSSTGNLKDVTVKEPAAGSTNRSIPNSSQEGPGMTEEFAMEVDTEMQPPIPMKKKSYHQRRRVAEDVNLHMMTCSYYRLCERQEASAIDEEELEDELYKAQLKKGWNQDVPKTQRKAREKSVNLVTNPNGPIRWYLEARQRQWNEHKADAMEDCFCPQAQLPAQFQDQNEDEDEDKAREEKEKKSEFVEKMPILGLVSSTSTSTEKNNTEVKEQGDSTSINNENEPVLGVPNKEPLQIMKGHDLKVKQPPVVEEKLYDKKTLKMFRDLGLDLTEDEISPDDVEEESYRFRLCVN